MIQSGWKPVLPAGGSPVWQRLVDALAADIACGNLPPSARLPPHRALADRLGLAVGTVSRAYAEAEKRGLVVSHVGKGTFVAERGPASLAHRAGGDQIDLSMNVPPVGPALAVADETLEALRHRGDLGAIFDYTFAAGLPVIREAGAAFLREFGGVRRARAERMIQTNGGQHALMLACSSVASAGDTVLCDLATYPGNRTIAEHGGWHLRGVPSDARGMDPAALERVATETGARLLLLIPTLHNPTTITIDAARRSKIVEIARRHDLVIVEDDIYRVFGREEEPDTLADLAPERVIHVTSVSKGLSPGLRLGFLLAPEDDARFERLLLGARATGFCPPAAAGLIFAEWSKNGLASRIIGEVRAEMRRRNELARRMLGEAMAEPASDCSLHAWLPMNAERANQVYGEALRANVALTPPDAPFVDSGAICGLRVCLGTPLEFDVLERGLQAVRTALDGGSSTSMRGVV